ncbi:PH domain-containing protein [Arthrobacter crusticola]|uniref:PH domain-containing protein n=1 Tax=Arthrobacter crusticola TaxID=2547960 RepID=A0A4R5TSW6_9MICC|nr:PH domain-containing protein [Arthrobacter crusticola]TDK23658.1 PH domain-containing protein [Arthrobacter crusticola]
MSSATGGPATTVFRPRTSKIFTAVAFALTAVGLVSVVVSEGVAGLLAGWPLLAFAFAAWWLFWYPSVQVDSDAVTLRNPLTTVSVPWAALVHVDTKFALKLITPRGSYTAWAAPAPGVWGTHAGKPEHLANLPGSSYGPGRSVRPGDLTHTDSGYAAFLVRSRWEKLIGSGSLDVDLTDSAVVARSVNWLPIGVAAALVAASFASSALA